MNTERITQQLSDTHASPASALYASLRPVGPLIAHAHNPTPPHTITASLAHAAFGFHHIEIALIEVALSTQGERRTWRLTTVHEQGEGRMGSRTLVEVPCETHPSSTERNVMPAEVAEQALLLLRLQREVQARVEGSSSEALYRLPAITCTREPQTSELDHHAAADQLGVQLRTHLRQLGGETEVYPDMAGPQASSGPGSISPEHFPYQPEPGAAPQLSDEGDPFEALNSIVKQLARRPGAGQGPGVGDVHMRLAAAWTALTELTESIDQWTASVGTHTMAEITARLDTGPVAPAATITGFGDHLMRQLSRAEQQFSAGTAPDIAHAQRLCQQASELLPIIAMTYNDTGLEEDLQDTMDLVQTWIDDHTTPRHAGTYN